VADANESATDVIRAHDQAAGHRATAGSQGLLRLEGR
jgi:hypothetical protein